MFVRSLVCIINLLIGSCSFDASNDIGEEDDFMKDLMRVEFTTEGGIAHFPGLGKPVAISSEQLSESDAQKLKRLVNTVDFFDRPARANLPAPGAADYRQYTITIEEAGRRHTVRLTDPIDDPGFKELMAFLRNKAKKLRIRERE